MHFRFVIVLVMLLIAVEILDIGAAQETTEKERETDSDEFRNILIHPTDSSLCRPGEVSDIYGICRIFHRRYCQCSFD